MEMYDFRLGGYPSFNIHIHNLIMNILNSIIGSIMDICNAIT